MFSKRKINLTIILLLITAVLLPVNAFAIGVYGRVGAPITGGSGGGPPPPPPPPPAPPADTTPPAISSIIVSNITTSGAQIQWTTNEFSASLLDYGLTSSYGLSAGGASATSTHTVNVLGLSAATTYHFRVRSADAAGNESFSLDQTFTTLVAADTTPPALSGITASNITGASADISWTTNEPSDSRLDYGETTAYEIGSLSTSTLRVSHSFTLTGLSPQTTYHFRLRSADAAGNAATSGDFSLTTLDTTPPLFTSGPTVSEINQTSVRLSWSTNEPTRGIVFYRISGSPQQTFLDNTLATTHSIILTGLIANSNYLFYARATDAAGNSADSASGEFRTLEDNLPPANVSDFAVFPRDAANLLQWANPPDADFAGVKIERSTATYPLTPDDGDTVFEGRATSFVDSGLTNGVNYFYTIFAYDTSGNFSSGALGQGQPRAAPLPEEQLPPEEQPPPEEPLPPEEEEVPPAPPPVAVPEATVPEREHLTLDAFNFRTAGRAIAVLPDDHGRLTLGPRAFLAVSTHISNLATDARRMVLNFAGGSYLFSLLDSFYDAGVSLPPNLGDFEANIIIEYIDDTTDVIPFIIRVEPHGFVYEIKDSQTSKLGDAEVTLYELRDGQWRVWDATAFNQLNPQSTADDGSYALYVPSGTYYLGAKKDGYRENKTSRFEAGKALVNSNLELIFKPELKIANTVKILQFGSRVAGQEVAQFIENPLVDEANIKIATPAAVAAVAVNTVTAVSVVNLWNYLQYLFTQPFLLFKRRKRAGWGIVYNSLTHVPVDLAIVRLYKFIGPISPIGLTPAAVTTPPPSSPSERGRLGGGSPISPISPIGQWKLVSTRVTGKDGRFIFFVAPSTPSFVIASEPQASVAIPKTALRAPYLPSTPPASPINSASDPPELPRESASTKYKLEISKPGFVFPTELLKDAKSDDPFFNVYHGEDIEVRQATALTPSIPLDPTEEKVSTQKIINRQVARGLRHGLSLGGVVFSGISFVVTPGAPIGIALLAQVVFYILFRRLAVPPSPKAWGIIYDARNGEPLGRVIARIFETQYNKLLGTQVTDTGGRYSFLVGKNAYYITYERAGYEEKKSEVIDLRTIKEPEIVAPNVGLRSLSTGPSP